MEIRVPDDAHVFRFPPTFKYQLFIALLFFLGILGFCLAMPYIQPKESHTALIVFMFGFFGPLAGYTCQVVRLCDDCVAVNNFGLWYVSPRKPPLYMDWRDVASVKARDWLQWLTLSDFTGRHTVHLEYQMEDFHRLRGFIIDHVQTTATDPPRKNRFTRSRYVTIGSFLMIFVFSTITWWAFRRGELGPAVVFLLFVLVSVASITTEPFRIKIGSEAVQLGYLIWAKKIPFSDISEVGLKNLRTKGQEIATVIIQRRNKKALKLSGFREGSLSLYRSIRRAWERAQAKEHRTKLVRQTA